MKNPLKGHWDKLIGTGIGLILLVVLIRQVSWEDVKNTMTMLTWQSIVWTLLLTVVVYGLRALRVYVMFKKQVPYKQFFLIMCAHNLANNVLPAPTGEFSFIYLVKRYTQFTTAYATVTLLVVRVLDLFVTLASFPILLAFLQNMPPAFGRARLIIWGLLAVGLVGMIVVYAIHEPLLNRLQNKQHNNKWKKKIAHFIVEGMDVIQVFKQQPVTLLFVFLLTVAIWASAFLSTNVLTAAMHLPLSFFGVAIGTTFVVIVSVLPVNSFLGIGVYEGAWTFAMVSMGVPLNLSIASGVTLHIIRVVTYVLFGLVGLKLFMAGQAGQSKSTQKIDAV